MYVVVVVVHLQKLPNFFFIIQLLYSACFFPVRRLPCQHESLLRETSVRVGPELILPPTDKGVCIQCMYTYLLRRRLPPIIINDFCPDFCAQNTHTHATRTHTDTYVYIRR